MDGVLLGKELGEAEGSADGMELGRELGHVEGDPLGLAEGDEVGPTEGDSEGDEVGTLLMLIVVGSNVFHVIPKAQQSCGGQQSQFTGNGSSQSIVS